MSRTLYPPPPFHGDGDRRSTWTDPEHLAAAHRLVNLVLVAWSLLRIAACRDRGLDVEGWMALVVLATAVRSVISGSWRPSTRIR